MATHPNIKDVTEATFERDVIQLSRQKPVVVDFWAPWCGPCRMLGPILERLAAEPGATWALAKINTDQNQNISMRFGIHGIPAVKAFRDGKVINEFVGAQPEPRVRQFLKAIAPTAADTGLEGANQLLANRKWAEAETAFRGLTNQEPGNTAARLGLARALLYQGKGCAAESALQGFPVSPEYGQAEKLRPLAQYLCQMSNGRATGKETGIAADYRLVAQMLGQGQIAAALYNLLAVLRQDKNYENGRAKEVMLGVFELLGERDPLTQEYRRQLAAVLF
jgi:putative thioredoxin